MALALPSANFAPLQLRDIVQQNRRAKQAFWQSRDN
jgi:hypothetical protein